MILFRAGVAGARATTKHGWFANTYHLGSFALDDDLKLRLPRAWKERLAEIADGEMLKPSDIVRRAISEYITGQDGAEKLQGLGASKAPKPTKARRSKRH